MKNKFLFNYYFYKYRDYPSSNRNTFRLNFHEKHGQFEELDNLILAIQRYQVKKYGETLQFPYNKK